MLAYKDAVIQPLLEVADLSISFTQYSSGLRQNNLQVISDLSLQIAPGQIVAVVGASGSGKSLLAHAILGILPGNAAVTGSICYAGQTLSPTLQRQLRGQEIALIPQSVNYLDPLMRVGNAVSGGKSSMESRSAQKKVLARYHLTPEVERLFPYQLSGGMARRVLLATAVLSDASLIIADEPTPGLDPLVLEEALLSLRELADEGRAVMLITHDIEMALKIADQIAVFYAGTTVEVANAEDFCDEGDRLRHPYSQALWQALPQNKFSPLPGCQPHPGALPSGCLFEPRCAMASHKCVQQRPENRLIRGGMVRCCHAS